MKKYKWIIWVVLALVAAAGIWAWKFRKEATVLVLQSEHPVMGTIANTVTATGTIQPVDTVAVGTQVSGTIKSVFVDFNATVRKGQLLAQLDKAVLLAQQDQYIANLSQAQANQVFQTSNYNRQQELYKAGAVSKAEVENALYLYNNAKGNVASIRAQLASAQRNLSFADIYSPIDGTVLSRSVSEGQTVAASLSTPTLFSIARDLTKMQVQASVDEADIGHVKQGQRVVFTVDAFPNDTFSGTVKEIRLRPSVSSNVVTYTTIVDAPNDGLKLKPGMTASITVFTKEVKNILLVSAQAVSFQPDSTVRAKYPVGGTTGALATSPTGNIGSIDAGNQAFVWLKKDSMLVHQPVVTGITDETKVQILSGVTETDEVVTGYQVANKQASAFKGTSSPFMPKPPGGNNKKNNQGPPQ
jgi:HlyD family secretion protein